MIVKIICFQKEDSRKKRMTFTTCVNDFRKTFAMGLIIENLGTNFYNRIKRRTQEDIIKNRDEIRITGDTIQKLQDSISHNASLQ